MNESGSCRNKFNMSNNCYSNYQLASEMDKLRNYTLFKILVHILEFYKCSQSKTMVVKLNFGNFRYGNYKMLQCKSIYNFTQ